MPGNEHGKVGQKIMTRTIAASGLIESEGVPYPGPLSPSTLPGHLGHAPVPLRAHFLRAHANLNGEPGLFVGDENQQIPDWYPKQAAVAQTLA
jgi:hypothetical protein